MTTTTTMDVIEHGRHLRSRAAPHPGTAASNAFTPLLHAALPLRILHPSSSLPSTRRYPPRSPPFARLFPVFLHSLALSLFLRPLSPLYPKNRTNPFRSFSSVFPLQPTLGAYGATHTIAFQVFYSLLPLTFESSPRGGFFASLCLLLCNYPLSFHRLAFPHLFRYLPLFAANSPTRPPGPSADERGARRKKREKRNRPKYDPRLSRARGAVWICARSEIRATVRTTRIYRRRRPRPRAAPRRALYTLRLRSASTRSRGRAEPERMRGREKERKRKRENKRSDRAQAGLTLHSSRLDFRL